MTDYVQVLREEFSLRAEHIENIIRLLDEGNTIPFIARYRKELTGSVDDQVLRQIADRLEYLRSLDKRREEVRAAIDGLEKLTPELSEKLGAAKTLAEIEDIYRPYRPTRKTRASVAREKGLEPLALRLLEQRPDDEDPLIMAAEYIDEEKGVATAQEALNGASDIVADIIANDAALRGRMRSLIHSKGVLVSTAATEDDSVYRLYYDFKAPIAKVMGHQVLAIDRGEREEILKASLFLPEGMAQSLVLDSFLKQGAPASDFVENAALDGYTRLLFPSLEHETRAELTANACEGAIALFGQNLKPLLLAPPVKGRAVLGLDPGYRTGCKFAIVDETGTMLHTGVIYVAPPHRRVEEAKAMLRPLIEKHGVSALAIGNGTASRETEMFAAELIAEMPMPLSYMMVSEAGASVYSASPLAAEEFPELDVSVRSAVSIARRLQDPLAELVKIDPKAIGVGQYQHDMPPKRLDGTLTGVVEDCVNAVGVDLNTASPALLSYVSGIKGALAKNIVSYRTEVGTFAARSELKKVPKLGARAYEQCAGFLRIAGGKNVLDNTAVHPESYKAASALLTLCGFSLKDVAAGRIAELPQKVKELGEAACAEQIGVGLPTLRDMVGELIRPGRDPRDELPPPLLRTDVMQMSDLSEGMVLQGTVRNVIDFGAFVDVGVHEDGLVHISQLADTFVRHPSDVVKVGDIVTVTVLSVDVPRKRLGLSMRRQTEAKA